MDFVEKFKKIRAFVVEYKNKKARFEFLGSIGIDTGGVPYAKKKLAESERLLTTTQESVTHWKRKLETMVVETQTLEQWLAENESRFEQYEAIASDKVQKLAEKLQAEVDKSEQQNVH